MLTRIVIGLAKQAPKLGRLLPKSAGGAAVAAGGAIVATDIATGVLSDATDGAVPETNVTGQVIGEVGEAVGGGGTAFATGVAGGAVQGTASALGIDSRLLVAGLAIGGIGIALVALTD